MKLKVKGRVTLLVWSSPVIASLVVPAIQLRLSLSVRQYVPERLGQLTVGVAVGGTAVLVAVGGTGVLVAVGGTGVLVAVGPVPWVQICRLQAFRLPPS